MSEELGSGKGLTRKVRHRYRVSDTQFRREMSVMLGPSITAGNRGTAASAAATESIDLVAACFVPDELLVDALVAALERGVRLRILLPGPNIDSETVKIASPGIMGGNSSSRCGHPNPSADHAPHEAPGHRRRIRFGRIDELRHALSQAQRRG